MTSFSPPVEIAAWLGCLSFAVFLFNQCTRAWFALRGKPTPGEIQAASAALSERMAEMSARLDGHERRLEKLEPVERDLRNLITIETSKIYNRVNAVADTTAQLAGKLDALFEILKRERQP